MRRIKISLPRFNVPTADDRSPDANTCIYICIMYTIRVRISLYRDGFFEKRKKNDFFSKPNGRFCCRGNEKLPRKTIHVQHTTIYIYLIRKTIITLRR